MSGGVQTRATAQHHSSSSKCDRGTQIQEGRVQKVRCHYSVIVIVSDNIS
jgi:hypothetical protein